jgi:hypothetical protein
VVAQEPTKLIHQTKNPHIAAIPLVIFQKKIKPPTSQTIAAIIIFPAWSCTKSKHTHTHVDGMGWLGPIEMINDAIAAN